jgi:hypothetical protein
MNGLVNSQKINKIIKFGEIDREILIIINNIKSKKKKTSASFQTII